MPGRKDFKILQSGHTKAQCVLMLVFPTHTLYLSMGLGQRKYLVGACWLVWNREWGKLCRCVLGGAILAGQPPTTLPGLRPQ